MPLMKPDLDFVFGLKAQLGEMVVIGECSSARPGGSWTAPRGCAG